MAHASMPLKHTVPNVQLDRDHVQNVRFRLIPPKEEIKISTIHQEPLFMKRLGDTQFVVGPRNELPVQAKTPAEAAAKAMKRFWTF